VTYLFVAEQIIGAMRRIVDKDSTIDDVLRHSARTPASTGSKIDSFYKTLTGGAGPARVTRSATGKVGRKDYSYDRDEDITQFSSGDEETRKVLERSIVDTRSSDRWESDMVGSAGKEGASTTKDTTRQKWAAWSGAASEPNNYRHNNPSSAQIRCDALLSKLNESAAAQSDEDGEFDVAVGPSRPVTGSTAPRAAPRSSVGRVLMSQDDDYQVAAGNNYAASTSGRQSAVQQEVVDMCSPSSTGDSSQRVRRDGSSSSAKRAVLGGFIPEADPVQEEEEEETAAQEAIAKRDDDNNYYWSDVRSSPVEEAHPVDEDATPQQQGEEGDVVDDGDTASDGGSELGTGKENPSALDQPARHPMPAVANTLMSPTHTHAAEFELPFPADAPSTRKTADPPAPPSVHKAHLGGKAPPMQPIPVSALLEGSGTQTDSSSGEQADLEGEEDEQRSVLDSDEEADTPWRVETDKVTAGQKRSAAASGFDKYGYNEQEYGRGQNSPEDDNGGWLSKRSRAGSATPLTTPGPVAASAVSSGKPSSKLSQTANFPVITEGGARANGKVESTRLSPGYDSEVLSPSSRGGGGRKQVVDARKGPADVPDIVDLT
jgi:hypothetical protein